MMGDQEPIEEPTKRSGHVSVSLGKTILIWGGYMDPTEGDMDEDEDDGLAFLVSRYMKPEIVWLYHCDIDRWQLQETFGSHPLPLSGAGAVLVPSRWELYVVCGFSNNNHRNDIYKLDVTTWLWVLIDILDEKLKPSPRDKFSAWEYHNNVYIFGGYGPNLNSNLCHAGQYFYDSSLQWSSNRGWNNQLLIFNTESLDWSNPPCTGSVPSPRAAHATARIEKTVYLFGGRHNNQRLNDLYSLDLTSLCWTQIDVQGEIPCGRSWHSLTPISEDYLFLFGGYSHQQFPLCDAWAFDVRLQKWQQMKVGENVPRLWHTAAISSDGDVVVFGGCTSDILSQPPIHTNKWSVFRFSPKSLLRLALDATYEHRDILRSEWPDLPRKLQETLNAKVNGHSSQTVGLQQTYFVV